MKRGRTAGGVMLLAGALLLAGCSYTPPRLLTEPLIEIDGDHGGHHRHERHDRHRHYSRHDAWHDDRHDRHRYHDDRRYRDHHRRSRFCPPGLAMQGRC